jgi:hypothetical protein
MRTEVGIEHEGDQSQKTNSDPCHADAPPHLHGPGGAREEGEKLLRLTSMLNSRLIFSPAGRITGELPPGKPSECAAIASLSAVGTRKLPARPRRAQGCP